MSEKVNRAIQRYIAKRLVSARKKAGLSQEALGEIVGLTRQRIGALESGESATSQKSMIAISLALNVPLAYFYPTYPSDSKPGEKSEMLDDMAKDAMQLERRELKIASLIVKTLRDNFSGK